MTFDNPDSRRAAAGPAADAAETASAAAASDHPAYGFDDGDDRAMLIVLHQETSTPGRVGMVLGENGVRLDIRRPVLGDPLPRTLDGHRGAIVFGGPPSANDTDDHLRREVDWMAIPLKENRPFLGICLGAQMLAKHLGAPVTGHPEGFAEIGYYPLSATEAGRAFMPGWPTMVYQWHREGFGLPEGADLLARGAERYPNQAFRYGDNAFAVQFHAELTLAMVHRWTTKGHERLALPGAQAREKHFAGRAVHDAAVLAWLKSFLPRVFGQPRGV